MQPETLKRKNKIAQNNSIVWLTVFILAVLIVATISVVGTCIYNYAHRSDCQISLYDGQIKESKATIKNAASQKKTNPVIKSQAVQYSGDQARQQSEKNAFEVDDTTQIWKTETAIELFKADYKNADGVVTVKSSDGSKVIAPGTEGSYTFSLKNTSDTSADYKIWVDAKLSSNMTDAPIQTRMSSNDGWLLGDKNSWKQAEALNDVTTKETIDAGKTAEYTIYWEWPFEQGKDEQDTELASASVSQDMSYTVTIYTMTASSTTSTNSSAITNNDDNQKHPIRTLIKAVKTGDQTSIIVWGMILVISAGIVFCLLILRKRKNEQNESE